MAMGPCSTCHSLRNSSSVRPGRRLTKARFLSFRARIGNRNDGVFPGHHALDLANEAAPGVEPVLQRRLRHQFAARFQAVKPDFGNGVDLWNSELNDVSARGRRHQIMEDVPPYPGNIHHGWSVNFRAFPHEFFMRRALLACQEFQIFDHSQKYDGRGLRPSSGFALFSA